MADTYFVRFRGRTVGPYSLAQAQQMSRKGQLSRTSEVSTDGETWTQAATFYEIFERPAAAIDSTKQTIASATAVASGSGLTTVQDFPKAPSLNEWYYIDGDSQVGPTSTSNIITMLKAGTLAAHDRVWREGLANWVSVSDVPEFSAAVGPALPQPNASRGGNFEGGAFCRECGARINRKAVICTQCGVPTEEGATPYGHASASPRSSGRGTNSRPAGTDKSRTVAALLALLLGGLGAHHFYLGNIVLGVIYLVFCLTFIPALIALIEGIVLLCMSDETFNAKYNS